jgi:hypothetical protein
VLRPGSRGPAAVVLLVFVIGVGIAAVLAIRALVGSSPADTPKPSAQPTRAQQHAAGVLSAFVYERGTYYAGGNVKACQPNWHPVANVVAQLHCRSFGQPTVYTRFARNSQASAYFKTLASRGQPATGDWGACKKWIPSSAWRRTILGDQKQAGQVAFRQLVGQAFVVWYWPSMRAVAETSGNSKSKPQLCRAWDLDS